MKVSTSDIRPYITNDGSGIREIIHPDRDHRALMSLAEATVDPGMKTFLHRHNESQEIYHITQGSGVMTLGNNFMEISAGDSVLIPAGTGHCVENTGEVPIRIMCCCSPPYSHEDTEILNNNVSRRE